MFATSFGNPGLADLSYRGVRTVDGERLHAYGLSNSAGNSSTDVTLLVTERGVIRRATSRMEVDHENGKMIVESTETYRAVNETTVEPPDWIDEAEARAAEG